MLFQNTQSYFTSNNPFLRIGDYINEIDGSNVSTGFTKQGIGKYYLDTPYRNVDFDSNGHPIGATALQSSSGLTEVTLVSGVIDGVNVDFYWSDTPKLVIFNTQSLTDGGGMTIGTGNKTTLYTAPMVGQTLSAFK